MKTHKPKTVGYYVYNPRIITLKELVAFCAPFMTKRDATQHIKERAKHGENLVLARVDVVEVEQ